MNDMTLRVAMAFGLESVVSYELRQLGYENQKKGNGFIVIPGDEKAIVECNLWLRSADRVYWQLIEFKGYDYDDMFQGIESLPWGDIIPKNGKVKVTARTKKSKITGVPSMQSVAKKGILSVLKRKYNLEQFPENGPLFHIEVNVEHDIVTVLLDTSGDGLGKRGYRKEQGEAPIRETLAAGIIDLARWKKERPLYDPMCGSGTFCIEAALRGTERAPGLERHFVSETWGLLAEDLWKNRREEARVRITSAGLSITGSDSLAEMIEISRRNAQRGGVSRSIEFFQKELSKGRMKGEDGVIITNPPYGQRLMDRGELAPLYTSLRRIYEDSQSASLFVITSDERFEHLFGLRSNKNRKLFNGGNEVRLYSFFGE